MAQTAAAEKIEYGPAEYGAELADFFTGIFEDKDGYRGRAHILSRPAGGGDFKTELVCFVDQLPAEAAALETGPDRDFYYTPNTFSGYTRRREYVFSLNNIVIDIDDHKTKDRQERAARLDKFIAELRAKLQPQPGYIVKSCRGVQILWPIEQESYKAAPRYIVVREDLIKQVEDIIKGNPEEFGALEMDAAASRNIAGIVRMPFTFNTKTAGETPDGAPLRAELLRIHDKRLRLSREEKRIAAKYGRSKDDIERGVHRLPSRRQILATEQAAMLRALPGIREAAGASLTGMRNNYFYLLANLLCKAKWRADLIRAEVLRINATLSEPMDENELERNLGSIFRMYEREGRGYPVNMTEIIEKLQITDEEAAQLALFVEPGTKREKKKLQRRREKDARNAEILDHHRQGKTATEAAAAAECSISTASRVIKAAGDISPAEMLRANICHLRQEGHTIAEIADITGVTKRTVYNHLRKARENEAEICPQSKEKAPAGEYIHQQAETATAATTTTQAAAVNEEGYQLPEICSNAEGSPEAIQGPAELPAGISAPAEGHQLPGSGAHETAPEWIRADIKKEGERFCKISTSTRRGKAAPAAVPCINIHQNEIRAKINARRPLLTPEQTEQRRQLIDRMRRNHEKRILQGLNPEPLPWPAREDPDRLRE